MKTIFLLLIFFNSFSSLSCKCFHGVPGIDDYNNTTDPIFIGTVIEIGKYGMSTFLITQKLKGFKDADTVFISNGTGSCRTTYHIGEKWLIKTYRNEDSTLQAGYCDRYKPDSKAAEYFIKYSKLNGRLTNYESPTKGSGYFRRKHHVIASGYMENGVATGDWEFNYYNDKNENIYKITGAYTSFGKNHIWKIVDLVTHQSYQYFYLKNEVQRVYYYDADGLLYDVEYTFEENEILGIQLPVYTIPTQNDLKYFKISATSKSLSYNYKIDTNSVITVTYTLYDYGNTLKSKTIQLKGNYKMILLLNSRSNIYSDYSVECGIYTGSQTEVIKMKIGEQLITFNLTNSPNNLDVIAKIKDPLIKEILTLLYSLRPT